jgi:phage shock protein C
MSDPQHPRGEHDDASRVIVLVLGAVLVVVGLVFLARQWLWPSWFAVNVNALLNTIRALGWGLGLIIIGILVIVASQRKGFTPPARGARLYRSRSNKMIAGVFGGLAEYLSMDATLLRLIYAGLALLFSVWPAVGAYIVATIIVPEEPEGGATAVTPAVPPSAAPAPAAPPTVPAPSPPPAPEPPPQPPQAAPSAGAGETARAAQDAGRADE